MMKYLKISFISIISILIIFYFSFLFILPNIINLNNYKKLIKEEVNKSAKLNIEVENLKLKTTVGLKIAVVIDNLKVDYLKEGNFSEVKKIEILVPLYPFLFKTFQIDKITVNSAKVNLKVLKDGKLFIQQYIENNIVNPNQNEKDKSDTIPLKFSKKLPDIIVYDYKVNIKDEALKESFEVVGPELYVNDFVLDKKIKIITYGNVRYLDNNLVKYNIKIDSFLPKIQLNNEKQEEKKVYIGTPFYNLIKYNLNLDILCDLKITQNREKDIFLKGIFNINDIAFNIKNKRVENTFLNCIFKKNKINVKAILNMGKNEKILLNGDVTHGKKRNIDLKCQTDKVQLEDLKNLMIALFDIASIKNDFDKLTVKGYLQSDFNLKSNMKTVKSNGYFKLKNGYITHSLLPLKITNITSDIDFSNNRIDVKNTKAYVNNTTFNVEGYIDEKAKINMLIKSESLPIADLYKAFAPNNLIKGYDISKGNLNLKILLKGNLKKINPEVSLNLVELTILDKINKIILFIKDINVSITSDLKKIMGNIEVSNANIKLNNLKSNVKSDKVKLKLDDKNIKIEPFVMQFNNSLLKIEGEVQDYTKNKKIDIWSYGTIKTNDIKQLIPKEIQPYIVNKGQLPIMFNLKGNGVNDNKVHIQVLGNPKNNISILEIDQLINKTSILNLELKTDLKDVNLSNVSLYRLNSGKDSLNRNLSSNIINGEKLINITGKIKNISTSNPQLSNITIIMPSDILLRVSNLAGSKVLLKTDLNLNGSIYKPNIKGFIKILSATIPDYYLKVSDLNININNQALAIACPRLDINGSTFDFDAKIPSIYDKVIKVTSLNVNTLDLDVDKVMKACESIPQNANAPGATTPLEISNGIATMQKIKMGELVGSNLKTGLKLKNDIVSLRDLNLDAYGGKVAGNIDYNLKYSNMKAMIQGRNLEANEAIRAFMGLKDQIKGNLDFDTELTLRGYTYEQQIRTMQGYANFIIKEGQMGDLGKFEHFLYAQNLFTQGLMKNTINQTLKTLAPKNTGQFSYLKGHTTFKNGWMYIEPVESSGKNMSLLIKGKFNLLTNISDINIYGRISQEVVNVLGPVGELSFNKILGNLGKFGKAVTRTLDLYNAVIPVEVEVKIPELTPRNGNNKSFKVVISGNIYSLSAVKTFKWLMTQSEASNVENQIKETTSGINSVKIPTKNEIKENIERNVREKVEQKVIEKKQQIRENIENKLPSFLKNLPEEIEGN